MKIDSVHGFVTDKQRYVQEILQDYDPSIIVLHIPPHLQETEDEKARPFRIVQVIGNEQHIGSMWVDGYGWCDIIMDVAADAMDARVLEEVFKLDNRRNNVAESIMAANAAQRLMEMKEQQDIQDAQREFALSVLQSPLHTFRHEGKVYR